MFSLKTKIIVAIVAFTGMFLLMPSGKVSALDCSPWAPENGSAQDNPSQYWGIASGQSAHGMAGLRVHAVNTKGDPINVGYELKSKLPAGNYGVPSDVDPSTYNRDARIFEWPVGTKGRDSQHWFKTGERIGWDGSLGGYQSGYVSYGCDGWSVLGPGNTADCPPAAENAVPCMRPNGKIAQFGNGWVLDCEEWDISSNSFKATDFWISSINNPPGEEGRYGGNWTIQIIDRGTTIYQGSDINRHFKTTNGATVLINLTWHPNAHNPTPPITVGRCEKLYVNGWGAYDTGAGTPNGSPRWRDTETYVRVTDANGNVLVPQPGDAKTASGDYAVLNGGPGYNQDKTWFYKPHTKTITTQVIRKWHKRNGTSYFWYEPTGIDNGYDPSNNTHTYTCYNASCDLSVQGNVSGRPNGVQSRSGFGVTAHVHNNGTPEGVDPLPAKVDGRPLILSSNPGSPVGFWYNPAAPDGIPKGDPDEWNTWDGSDGIVEPGWNIGNYGVGAKLYYDFDPNPGVQGSDLVVADCTPTSYDVYKRFDLSLSTSVDLSPTAEDPNNVTYSGRAAPGPFFGIPSDPPYNGNISVDYTAKARKKLYGGVNQIINSQSGRNSTPVVYQWSTDPRPNHAGDKYFMDDNDFCVGQTFGWIGPGNNFSADTQGNCAQKAQQYIYDRPYLKAYGADVVSGSNFRTGDTCDTTGNAQKISAYRSTESTKGGSGVQFAAIALDQISGFGSASTRTSSPTWPTGLTFANTLANGGGGSDQPNDGGFYAGQAVCTKDFYSTLKTGYKKAAAGSNTIAKLNNLVDALNAGKPTQFLKNGNLVITAGGEFTKQATIFVKGNVTIRGNITFQPGSYLAIIAQGDIRIKNTVTRLDGLYVAQPKDAATGGVIYTCTQNNGTPYTNIDTFYANCRNQLVINGAFVAKNVKFSRVAHSLRESTSKEVPSDFSAGTGTNAAEIFNFSPELYLYTPIFNDASTGQPYQYITTLPPVL